MIDDITDFVDKLVDLFPDAKKSQTPLCAKELLTGYQTQQTDSEIVTPTSYEEAISGPQREQWMAAIKDEMRSHGWNVVWTLVTAPKGANIVSCQWVFKLKRLPDGWIDRYKARLVARGFSQQYGVDYDETFAAVVRMETLRILLAIAAAEDLEIHQMDVVTAYLAGELKEEIYMTPSPGVPDTEGLVCRLWKGLYGLKQSARVWNQRLTGELKRMGLRATTADPSVWVNKDRGLMLALYVDDIVLFARDPQGATQDQGGPGTGFQDEGSGGDPERARPQGATTQSHTTTLDRPDTLY
jgi:hypothetical protein